MAEASTQPSYPTREEVDFVIVGSGAAGGVMAKELSSAGFSVVVLEQGAAFKGRRLQARRMGLRCKQRSHLGRAPGLSADIQKVGG